MAFTEQELSKLKRLHPDLVKVVKKADALGATFRVGETTRSLAQQEYNVAHHVSWTLKSRHLPSKDGLARAVDLLTLVAGKVTWAWQPYRKTAHIIYQAALDCKLVDKDGIPLIRWGGTWKRLTGNEMTCPLNKQADGPHFELWIGAYP